MTDATRSDIEIMRRLDGLYVGQLDADEYAAFQDLRARGLMVRDYDHAGGLLGLAQVRLTKAGRVALTPATQAAE